MKTVLPDLPVITFRNAKFCRNLCRRKLRQTSSAGVIKVCSAKPLGSLKHRREYKMIYFVIVLLDDIYEVVRNTIMRVDD